MRVRCRRATVMAIATGAAIVVTTGTASAYWLTAGTGQGSARTATPGGLDLRPGVTTAALAPGGTADVKVLIGNPTAAPVLVTSVTTPTGGIPGFSDAALLENVSGCDAGHSGVSVVKTTPRATSFVIAPHGSYALTLADAVRMNSSSANSCQGVFFAVPLKIQAQTVVGSAATVPAEGTL